MYVSKWQTISMHVLAHNVLCWEVASVCEGCSADLLDCGPVEGGEEYFVRVCWFLDVCVSMLFWCQGVELV